MASTTYLAPGVYVEEVPSAQQPIAGVGTNTVAFLGIVPDVIYYPEPNPDYDPVLAQAALRLETLRAQLQGASNEDRTRIAREMATARQKFESVIARLQKEIEDLESQILRLAAEERNAPSDTDAESASGSVDQHRVALTADRGAKEEADFSDLCV